MWYTLVYSKVLIVFEDVVGVFTSLSTHSFTAQGHGVLEMPSGTGKTISLLSLIVAYQKVSLMCSIIIIIMIMNFSKLLWTHEPAPT